MFDCCRAIFELALFVAGLLGGEYTSGVCCHPACDAYAAGCTCKECVCAPGKTKCCCGEPCKCPNCPGKTIGYAPPCPPMPAPSPVAVYVNGAMPEPIAVPPPAPLPPPAFPSTFCCPLPPPPPPPSLPLAPPAFAVPPGHLPYLAHLRVCYPGDAGARKWVKVAPVVVEESKPQTITLTRSTRPEEPPCDDRLQVTLAPCAPGKVHLKVRLEQPARGANAKVDTGRVVRLHQQVGMVLGPCWLEATVTPAPLPAQPAPPAPATYPSVAPQACCPPPCVMPCPPPSAPACYAPPVCPMTRFGCDSLFVKHAMPKPAPAPAMKLVTCAVAESCCVKKPASTIALVHEGGKHHLAVKAADGCCTTCVRMAMQTKEMGKVRFAAGARHVHVHGRMWKATADRVELSGGDLVLCGHVKVLSDKVGACAALKAECVTVRLKKDGCVEAIRVGAK